MSVQDRYMVCTRRTIGSTRISFRPFGHGANLDARYVYGLRRTYHRIGIHFDAPDGTPRRRESCGISLLSISRKC